MLHQVDNVAAGLAAATIPNLLALFVWVNAKAIGAAALGTRPDIFMTDTPQPETTACQFIHDQDSTRTLNAVVHALFLNMGSSKSGASSARRLAASTSSS